MASTCLEIVRTLHLHRRWLTIAAAVVVWAAPIDTPAQTPTATDASTRVGTAGPITIYGKPERSIVEEPPPPPHTSLAGQAGPKATRIDAELILSLGGVRIEDIAGLVPGLQVDVLNAGLSSAVKLRGFAVTRLHYNGMPDVQRMFTRDLVTVDRIDVLAGPSALALGITSPGGVMHYVGKQPRFKTSHTASFKLDSNGVGRAEIDLTGRMGHDQSPLAFRLVAAGQDGTQSTELNRHPLYAHEG